MRPNFEAAICGWHVRAFLSTEQNMRMSMLKEDNFPRLDYVR
jgi:hypothetical protein